MALRKYRDRFLNYIKKEDFDKMRHVDPLEYHSMFVTWMKIFNVMDCDKKMWMYITPIGVVVIGITGLVIALASVVHYVQNFDLNLVTENGNYALFLIYKLFTLATIQGGTKEYSNLLEAMKDDFHYVCTKKRKYRGKYLENHRLSFQASLVVTIGLGVFACGMVATAYIAVAISMRGQESDGKRLQPYAFWFFDYDINTSPGYEMMFLASMVFSFTYCYQYSFMSQSQIIWIREAICKADFVTWNLQELLVDVLPAKNNEEKEHYATLIKQRMNEIVQIHLSMFKLIEDFAAVYMKCLLFEQVAASPVICMTAYCFVEKYEAGELQLIFLVQCFATVSMVFIPNYLCTQLNEKVQSISDACYDIPFWNAGPVIRPYLILIMQRSIRPLPISAPGFGEVSLQTYSTIITRAYSGFNMLRQLDLDFTK